MRGIAGTVLFALLVSATVKVGAATIMATSCNASDVQAALNQASAGDTVLIPAGTCRWSTRVSWTAPPDVTLRGAGDLSVIGGGNATVIIDDYAANSSVLNVQTNAAGTFRLAGITIRGGGGGIKESGVLSIGGASKQFRVDHIHIDMQSYTTQAPSKPIYFGGALNGVMDHVIIDLAKIGWVHFAWADGDAAFAAPTAFGTSNFVFVEDSQFNAKEDPSNPTLYMGVVSDCNSGGRFVIRYNNMVSAAVGQTHPTGGAGRGRGCRAHELYGNTVTPALDFNPATDSPNFVFSWMSSGTSMVWGNTANGVYKGFIHLDAMRKSNATYNQSSTPNGWGFCGNTFNGIGSNWDGNTDWSSGYPCLDQPGRGQSDLLSGMFPNAINTRTGTISWPNQALEPVREWLNTFTAVRGWGNESSNHISVAAGAETRLAENRDFFRDNPSFNGTSGVGAGPRSSRPVACTTGVAYWSTDQGGNWNTVNSTANDGTLDVCTAPNTWTNAAYTPYSYPHPLTQGQTSGGGSSSGAPAPPANLRISS